jgi:hypothetical protein
LSIRPLRAFDFIELAMHIGNHHVLGAKGGVGVSGVNNPGHGCFSYICLSCLNFA